MVANDLRLRVTMVTALAVGGVMGSQAPAARAQPATTAAAQAEDTLELVEQEYKKILGGDQADQAAARARIRELMEAYFRARHVPLEPRALPFHKGWWKVTQGNSTKYTHQGTNQFCWDFELVDRKGLRNPADAPVRLNPHESYSYGRPIYAVAPGRVWINDGGVEGDSAKHNTIVVHHDDGTRAVYDHIKTAGFAVKTGQRVHRGQLLGYVGYAGTSYAHLHFSVRCKAADDWSLPIRFIRYYVVDPKTGRVEEVAHGCPVEGQIIAASREEAQTPSIP